MVQDDDTLPQPEPLDRRATGRRSRIYYGWRLLAAAAIISVATRGVLDSFDMLLLPMAWEFGWSRLALSGAFALGQLINGVSQPIIGYLFDRFDSRRVILTCVAATGLTTVGLYWTSHFWYLLFLFSFVLPILMGGASLAILWPLAARWFLKRLGLALGLLAAATALGRILWPVAAGLFVFGFGWHGWWPVLGAIVLFLALPAGLVFLRNWPSDMGLKPDGEPETPLDIQSRGSRPAIQRGSFEVDRWWRAFRYPVIWALMPGLAVGGLTGFISSQIVQFAVDQGHPSTMASNVHSVMIMLSAVGAIAAGWLSDRVNRKCLLGVIYVAQSVSLLALVLGSETLAGLLVFSVLAGLCWGAWMPIAFALIVDVYGLRALGVIGGLAFLCQQIGALAAPVVIGLAQGLTGFYALPFVASAVMLVIVSVATFAINERKYSGRYQAAVTWEEAGN